MTAEFYSDNGATYNLKQSHDTRVCVQRQIAVLTRAALTSAITPSDRC